MKTPRRREKTGRGNVASEMIRSEGCEMGRWDDAGEARE